MTQEQKFDAAKNYILQRCEPIDNRYSISGYKCGGTENVASYLIRQFKPSAAADMDKAEKVADAVLSGKYDQTLSMIIQQYDNRKGY